MSQKRTPSFPCYSLRWIGPISGTWHHVAQHRHRIWPRIGSIMAKQRDAIASEISKIQGQLGQLQQSTVKQTTESEGFKRLAGDLRS